jgi:hypothetical protein
MYGDKLKETMDSWAAAHGASVVEWQWDEETRILDLVGKGGSLVLRASCFGTSFILDHRIKERTGHVEKLAKESTAVLVLGEMLADPVTEARNAVVAVAPIRRVQNAEYVAALRRLSEQEA